MEEKNIKLSIVALVYNLEKYLPRCLDALVNQTLEDIEILCVDDGSTDSAPQIIDEYEKKYPNKVKVFHKENEGLAATRDFGAKNASECTKYLLFMDSDDLIEPTYMECAYWTLETNKGASWAYTDSIGFEGQEYTWNKWFDSNRMKKINDLVEMNMIRKEDFWSG